MADRGGCYIDVHSFPRKSSCCGSRGSALVCPAPHLERKDRDGDLGHAHTAAISSPNPIPLGSLKVSPRALHSMKISDARGSCSFQATTSGIPPPPPSIECTCPLRLPKCSLHSPMLPSRRRTPNSICPTGLGGPYSGVFRGRFAASGRSPIGRAPTISIHSRSCRRALYAVPLGYYAASLVGGPHRRAWTKVVARCLRNDPKRYSVNAATNETTEERQRFCKVEYTLCAGLSKESY
jgi:hypothetical protein